MKSYLFSRSKCEIIAVGKLSQPWGQGSPTEKNSLTEDELTMRIVNQPPTKMNHNKTESTNEIELAPSKVERVHASEKNNGKSVFQVLKR